MHLMTEWAIPNMLRFKAEKHRFAAATAIEQAQLLIQEGYEDVTEMDGRKTVQKEKMNATESLCADKLL
jgi:hypothetical protein